MDLLPAPSPNSRTGLHYFPDTLHYRDSDLSSWLAELKTIQVSWLVLETPCDRAIPEAFITGLVNHGIQPILHFKPALDALPAMDELGLLFQVYADWGVHYMILFDRPNLRKSWPAASWAQSHLVERFLDIYLPIAENALQAGLIPVFPALEPGGDFWDLAFLRLALEGIRRRGHSAMIDRLVLAAYAHSNSHPVNWGAGGPERWPEARPYVTPAGSEDQRGFRIFDWYRAIAQAAINQPCHFILLQAAENSESSAHDTAYIEQVTEIWQRLVDEGQRLSVPGSLEPIPPDVLACCFWLLSTAEDSPYANQAWFTSQGQRQPVVSALKGAGDRALAGQGKSLPFAHFPAPRNPALVPHTADDSQSTSEAQRPIVHYLLLPTFEWGVPDWLLDVIRPYIKKYRPTIGFSISEAAQAERVTIIGGPQSFPESAINELRQSGCTIEQINGDGTSIATQLQG